MGELKFMLRSLAVKKGQLLKNKNIFLNMGDILVFMFSACGNKAEERLETQEKGIRDTKGPDDAKTDELGSKAQVEGLTQAVTDTAFILTGTGEEFLAFGFCFLHEIECLFLKGSSITFFLILCGQA